MHSTLHAELRATRRVIDLVRPHLTGQAGLRSRAFSHRPRHRNEEKVTRSRTISRAYASDNSKAPESSLTGDSQPSKLGSDIERWINHLSQTGRSLEVWDTISEKDETGMWRLSPQAQKDLEGVHNWAKENSIETKSPFGIKVADGRIQALSSQELRKEQESAVSTSVVHGPFSPSTVARDISLDRQNDPLEESIASKLKSESTSAEGKPIDVSQFIAELPGASGTDTPRFHGSAAARRQRAQRTKDKTTSFVLPSWFIARNTIRRGRQGPTASRPLRIARTQVRDSAVSLYSNTPGTIEASRKAKAQGRILANSEAELLQTEETGGDQGVSSEDPAQSGNPGNSTTTPPSSVMITSADGVYFIEESQHNELIATAKGRLRPPASGTLDNRPGGIRGHLIIHFAASDGEVFLDHLVEDVAQRLDCNLITLDAQDISSLIIKADVDSMLKHEAAVLGYEIYSEIYKDDSPEQDANTSFSGEEPEDVEEDTGTQTPQGMPFVVGRPVTIDLKALFSPKPHRRSSGARTSNMMPDIFGPASSAKPSPPLFSGIVEAILSSIKPKPNSATEELNQDNEQQLVNSGRGSTIVHVKDLRAIQDSSIGKQFLMQLYDQVERHRSNGESIMLVGTECSRDERASYDQAKISNMQSSDQDEISSTLVITPVEIPGENDFASDRTKRIQAINTRHLWQMLQSKNLTLDYIEPGSWKSLQSSGMHVADAAYLGKSLWSFGYVQRLSAILASSDLASSQHPIAEAAAIIEMSDNSKFNWAKQGRKGSDTEKEGRSITESADRIAKIRTKASRHEKKLLGGVIEPKKIATTFNDIHIPKDTIESLQTLTTLSLTRPDAFRYGVLASDRIPGLLLYGPPGTGKTLAAKAVARESGATMLEVSSADINDMYVGEGEKNVKALFSLAKKLSPCVVFLDEADAMFSTRRGQGHRVSHRELLNQFLREWDGMSNDAGSAFIMVATNRPMDLDDAVLRRLPRRLLIDLPTETDRLEILKIHLRHEQLAKDVNLSQIATKTPFYSGSDLKNLAVSAALNAVREENADAQATLHGKSGEYPAKRTLTARHFEKALEEISASISEDMASLKEIKKFDEQYGDKRGGKRKSPKWGFKTSTEADKVLDTVKVRS